MLRAVSCPRIENIKRHAVCPQVFPCNLTPTCITSSCDRLERFPISSGRRGISSCYLLTASDAYSEGFCIALVYTRTTLLNSLRQCIDRDL